MTETWKPGDRVIWLQRPSGGYGYIVAVPGCVEAIGAKRIRIRIKPVDSAAVSRWVSPTRLRRDTREESEGTR